MIKQYTCFLFAISFVLYTIVPNVLVLVDDSFETSIVHNLGDEESEKEENEGRKKIKIEFAEFFKKESSANSQILLKSINYYLVSFSELHSENTSPPPEFI